MIGLDDLDEDVLERMDYQEAKLESIEEISKLAEKKLMKMEVELKRKMLSTLNEAHTLKEEIVQTIQIVKRDKYEVIKIGDEMKQQVENTMREIER